MPDILNDLPIKAPIADVFQAVATPQGLDQWWTQHSAGRPILDTEYQQRALSRFLLLLAHVSAHPAPLPGARRVGALRAPAGRVTARRAGNRLYFSLPHTRGARMSAKSDEQKLAKLIKKNVAKAAAAKQQVKRNYDSTLKSETTDEDIERRDFFSEMKKREF
jgi:hypothetical protein